MNERMIREQTGGPQRFIIKAQARTWVKNQRGVMDMEKVVCPNCGQLMRRSALSEVQGNGKRIAVYVCPNSWGCGTVVQKEE